MQTLEEKINKRRRRGYKKLIIQAKESYADISALISLKELELKEAELEKTYLEGELAKLQAETHG